MKNTQAWLPLMFAIVLIVGLVTGYKLRERIPAPQGFFQNSSRSAIQESIDLIRMHYVDPISTDSLSDDAIQAMLTHLDPHSIFIPAKYLQEANEDLQGNFEGIGVEFQIINDTVHVVNVLPGGPSAKAGVKTGDKFLKVGDSIVAGNHITSERIKLLLRGEEGSTIEIDFQRGSAIQKVSVARGMIPLYSVDASYMMDSITGYIHLNKFSGTSYEECMAAFEKLNKLGMKKLLFDLRDNGGGILGEAVDIADEFLDQDKLIVYTQGDKQPRQEYRCKRPGQFEKGKLVMLVNEGSASASEVLAGAMQDWDRATIVGRRTFGKGLVQSQYDLNGGGALRLTVARYYTPTGRSIQKSYAKGRTAYNDEVLERFHNGEVTTDTVQVAKGHAFKTNSGRVVYGGGGITPDIFVPLDSTGFKGDLSPLFANQNFGKFIYEYYIHNQAFFNKFKNAADFSAHFVPDENTWKTLEDYIADNDIRLSEFPAKDKNEIGKRIKAWMARQLWGMSGYYEVSNLYDLTVQRARQVN
ncbi:MAG: S41 family peptidase [Flavitalea sp.]